MITFNDLRINDDKSQLVIDCIIDSGYETKDVWIRSIKLVNYDNILSDGLISDEDKVVTVYDDSDGAEMKKSFAGDVSTEDLEPIFPDKPNRSFDKGLFYVIVTCDGSDVPSDYYDYVVVPDWQFIYSIGMPYVAHIAAFGTNSCVFPSQFEEFTIIWYALQLAFSTCEFSLIHQLWDRFLRAFNVGDRFQNTPCHCNQ